MKNKWLPILMILLPIASGYGTYLMTRTDKAIDSQSAYEIRAAEARAMLYKEYIPRPEYEKDYRGFCERFTGLENMIKDQNEDLKELGKEFKRMFIYLKNNK